MNERVSFEEYTALASNGELAGRLLSPLKAQRVRDYWSSMGRTSSGRVIDLRHESFTVFVPSQAPVRGYGLLVFIPPWEEARVPAGWGPVLNRQGVLFVSAANSGNRADIMNRRQPLALLAYYNLSRLFPLDRTRLYVGGFSGGARVALRLALGYPDVFRGVLLDAGSDPIGNQDAPLPPPALFAQAQERLQVVMVSGGSDSINVERDAQSAQSLRHWCLYHVSTDQLPGTGHEPVNSAGLARALHVLDAPPVEDMNRLEACRQAVDRAMRAGLRRVGDLVQGGKPAAASALLNKLDTLYGGLAAPRSTELEQALRGNP